MKYIQTYEETKRGQEVVYTFKTKAKSGPYEYNIHLLQGDPRYDKTNGHSYNGLILSIDTTPGSWYVATYLHYSPNSKYSNTISISGNDWICTNRREITEELLEWIENVYPVYQNVNKYNI